MRMSEGDEFVLLREEILEERISEYFINCDIYIYLKFEPTLR